MIDVNYHNLYNAWLNFRKGKRPSSDIDVFAYNLETYLTQLSLELSNGSYQHGRYSSVVLQEKKRRDLSVATVRDRVVHRLLYDYLVGIYDKSFDPDVWSCRKDKGLYACLERTQGLLNKYNNSFVWRSDITKFYDNVNKATLCQLLNKKIGYDKKALSILDRVVDSYPELAVSQSVSQSVGIPIGNLTSQIFSNIYLHEFDRFVRHSLRPQAYVRYGDDFIVFFPTRLFVHQARALSTNFLNESLGLSVNPKNDVVLAARQGLKFLGHYITKNSFVVDKHTTRSVLSKLDWHNVASYRALALETDIKARFNWTLLEKDVDV